MNVYEVSNGKATYLTGDTVHNLLNTPEHGNATFIAFNVLTQSTKGCKPSPTGRAWAYVDFGPMDRASEMLVQSS